MEKSKILPVLNQYSSALISARNGLLVRVIFQLISTNFWLTLFFNSLRFLRSICAFSSSLSIKTWNKNKNWLFFNNPKPIVRCFINALTENSNRKNDDFIDIMQLSKLMEPTVMLKMGRRKLSGLYQSGRWRYVSGKHTNGCENASLSGSSGLLLLSLYFYLQLASSGMRTVFEVSSADSSNSFINSGTAALVSVLLGYWSGGSNNYGSNGNFQSGTTNALATTGHH